MYSIRARMFPSARVFEPSSCPERGLEPGVRLRIQGPIGSVESFLDGFGERTVSRAMDAFLFRYRCGLDQHGGWVCAFSGRQNAQLPDGRLVDQLRSVRLQRKFD